MDLFAEMLIRYLPQTSTEIEAETFRLALKRRIGLRRGRSATTLERLIGRNFDYPRELRRRKTTAEINHIVDQSYAAAVSSLPRGRTVVTCHDMDVFAPLVRRRASPGDFVLSAFAKSTLTGLQSAAHVACVSQTVKDELVGRGWVAPDKITVNPGGVHPACSPDADPGADASIHRLLGTLAGPEILHVGSTIPRKRIDTLLEAFAGVRRQRPDVRLLRAGGPFTENQCRMLAGLGLTGSVVTLPFLSRMELAALYRRAELVVLPSESEGFGLPLIEAMACGTPVLASNLDVFREVAGEATAFSPVGNAPEWTRAILALLDERENSADDWRNRIERGMQHAMQYSWPEHARRLSEVYASVLNR